MDRAQFMKQLERLLSDISEAEKQEALAYYNSYFDEAGPENEASVIRELGSPGKVAAIIKADLDESNEEYAQYTENGYEDLRENKASYMPEIRQRDGEHAGKTDRMFCILTGWLGSTIFPWILRKVTDFFQKIVYRNKKEEQA